jgi:hypothetical protein
MTPTRRTFRLQDEVLPEKLFRALLEGVKRLGTRGLRRTYQTTFWFDLSQPRGLPEEAALHLRRWVPRGKRVVGVEWWLSRMRTTNVQVDFHRDRDERLALRTGRIVHPRWSSLLFLNRCRGGLLALTDAPPNPENESQAPDDIDFDLVAPRPNRFVLFEGRMTHGVLDAHNQIPTRRLTGRPPLRLSIAFNWWHRRPEGVPTWQEARAYRELEGTAILS